MTQDQEQRATQMLEEGKSYSEIAQQLGGGLRWNDVQVFAWEKETLSWQGAKKAISLRLKRFATATQQQERENLADEIDQFVEYLYHCARKAQDRIESARRVLG